jgi:hypothetical protein
MILPTDRKRIQNRNTIVFYCSLGLLLTAFGSRALAGDNSAKSASPTTFLEGSKPTHRADTDNGIGELNIYVGGSLPARTQPVAMSYLFDQTSAGNTTGYITPLLFEYKSVEAATVYTVVGIGKGFKVSLFEFTGVIPFEVVEGIKVTTGANFTFGFVMSIVNSSGIPVLTGQGVVDFDTPSDTGEGVGGAGTTNDWAYSAVSEPTVALGTTFGLANADYQLGLPYRTYSAQVTGVLLGK